MWENKIDFISRFVDLMQTEAHNKQLAELAKTPTKLIKHNKQQNMHTEHLWGNKGILLIIHNWVTALLKALSQRCRGYTERESAAKWKLPSGMWRLAGALTLSFPWWRDFGGFVVLWPWGGGGNVLITQWSQLKRGRTQVKLDPGAGLSPAGILPSTPSNTTCPVGT